MADPGKSNNELVLENAELRAQLAKAQARLADTETQLAEAQEVIRAIQSGDVDAVVVSGPQGEQVFTLKGEEHTYRTLVETINEGAATLAADGAVLYCNQRLADLAGVPQQQIIGGPIAKLIPSHERKTFEAAFSQALGGRPSRAEVDFEGNDRRVPVYVSFSGLKDSEPAALAMVVTDLTEQKVMEELRQSQEWLRVTLSSIGDAVIATDDQGRITFLNPVAAELTGWRPKEAQGQPIQSVFQIVNEETLAPAEDIVARVLQEKYVIGLANHTALCNKDGRILPIEDSAAPILDSAGNTIGVVLVFHDVTERRRAEAALRESEAKYRRLFDSIQEMVTLFEVERDQQGRIVERRLLDANPASVRVAGYSSVDQMRGKSAAEIFGEIWSTLHREPVQRAMDSGNILTQEIHHPGSNRHYITTIVPLDAKTYLGTGRDITDRKRAEEGLLRSEKLASVGRLAASIAHEINNPLAAVVNTIFLARTNADDPSVVRQFLDMADDELKRISHLTRQTLGFYRESTVPTAVSVGAIMDSAVDLLKAKIRLRNACIQKQYDGDLQITAVSGELRQVFSNVLANSLDAMDEPGLIKVRVSRSRSVHNGQPRIKVTVADGGRGIPLAILPRIFEPLFTTKEGIGAGLGLWVCKQLIDKHHGCIRVRTKTDGRWRGTTFSIVLPVGGAEAQISVT